MIDAFYYDGQTARRRPVTLVIHKGMVVMRGDGIHHSVKISRLFFSEKLEHAPRLVRFPNGGFIETKDVNLDAMLRQNGYREPWIVRCQQNWPLSLLALIFLLVLLVSGYQWGLPWAADNIAQHMPAAMEKKIGDEELKLIDEHYMQPSRLDQADQVRLRQLFANLKQPRGEKTLYRLEFRDSKIGPNAFALPNGVIVMTDQLVKLSGNDLAVLAVLGHELGHVQRRHSLRRLLQALGVGVVVNIFVGDVSSALAAVPTLLLDQKYSRDFEREADQYAIDMMRFNRVPLSPMAELFEKMSAMRDGAQETGKTADHQSKQEQDDEDDVPKKPGRRKAKLDESSDYLSSHPSDRERIARLRAADNKK